MRREPGKRRRKYLVVLTCVLLGVILGAWHDRAAERGVNDPVTGTIRTVTAPFVRAFGAVSEWFGRQIGWLVRGRSLDIENRSLRAENAMLKEDRARLRESDAGYRRLRQQLGFASTPPLNKLAADVLAVRPNPAYETIVISRGSRDGVIRNSVAVTPSGIVGHVYDVAPTTSAVLLITDSHSAIGASVQRPESRATGVCRGDGSNSLSLVYLNVDADVKVGDAIVSSGLGGGKGIFPKGLPIGTVQSVTIDTPGSTRQVRVRPAVELNRLEEVYVVK